LVNLHDLGDDSESDNPELQGIGPKTEAIIRKSAVDILSVGETVFDLSFPSLLPLAGCRLCQMVPTQFGEKLDLPQGSKQAMQEHVEQA